MLSLSCPLTIDGTAPTGALTSPTAGATVSGTVQLAATAADQVGIWKVDYKVDGTTKGTVTGPPPYSYAWSSLQVADGAHTVTALITDYAGNTVSSTVNVNVQNSGATANRTDGADAQLGHRGQRQRHPQLVGADIRRRLRDHRLPRLPLQHERRRDPAHHARHGHQLHRHRPHQRQHLLLQGQRREQRRRKPPLERTLRDPRRPPPAHPPSTPPTAGNGTVTLSWTTPNGNGSTVTGYRVYRSTSSGTETLLTTLGALNAYTDTGLSQRHHLLLQGHRAQRLGESSLSNERSATPATTAQRADAQPGDRRQRQRRPQLDNPDGNGSALTGYRVYRSTTSGNETLLTTLGLVNSYTDTGRQQRHHLLLQGHARSTPSARAASPTSARPRPPRRDRPARRRSTRPRPARRASASPGRHRRRTAARAHRLPRLPLHEQRQRDPAHHARPRQRLHRHRPHQRHHLLLQGHRRSTPSARAASRSERSATPTAAPTVPARRRSTHPPPATAASASPGRRPTATAARSPATASTAPPRAAPRPCSPRSASSTATPTPALSNGTTYYYKVTALNAVGESNLSSERSATPPAATPSAPTLNTATAGNGSVGLSWTTPSGNGSALTGYRVYRSTTSGAETLLTTLGLVNSYTDTGLSQRHHLLLQGQRAQRVGESGLSSERSATPAAHARRPGAQRRRPPATAASPQLGDPRRRTAAPSPATASTARPAAATRPLLDHPRRGQRLHRHRPHQRHHLLLQADRAQRRRRKQPLQRKLGHPVAPATTPGAPTLNSATPSNNTVSLNWSAPASDGGSAVTGYRVYRSTTSGERDTAHHARPGHQLHRHRPHATAAPTTTRSPP